MIPLWMFPMAIATGNTFVLKPSEQDPMVTMRLCELALEAGIPPGVLNVVHGGEDVVNAICDHPDIKAISFVGSTKVGTHVYNRASLAGKRVQCMMGAKNHAIVMPDANKEQRSTPCWAQLVRQASAAWRCRWPCWWAMRRSGFPSWWKSPRPSRSAAAPSPAPTWARWCPARRCRVWKA